MNWVLKLIISALIFFPPLIKPQQNYSGTSLFNCNSSQSSLYKCTHYHSSSCPAFLIFKATSPFNTLAAIATLTSSNLTLLSQLNYPFTPFTLLSQGQQLIIPLNCSCPNRQHYESIATYPYPIPSHDKTYFTIANHTYQGLSTCDSLKRANPRPGSTQTIRVPLRCACPTPEQKTVGINFLLTYSISRGDTLYALSKRFNVSVTSISEANCLSDQLSTIYPFTTILIPLQNEPHNINNNNNNQTNSPFPPLIHVPKRRSNTLVLAVGISTGSFSLLLLLLVIFILRLRASKQRRNATPQDLINLEIARLDRARALKEFEFSEINKATRNFASKRRVLDSSVYRGTFKKQVLAVKKSRREAYHKEMKILHKINHFNIIKLHGFCEHKQDLYLVHEYMNNGSLEEWLRSKGSEGAMSWKQRISIALDVANGLLYLHSFANPAYVHNDVTSCNILLDGNLRAKISHFSVATEANGDASPKVDVYGLGIVLLELITDKYEVYDKETLLSTVGAVMQGQNTEGGLSRLIGPQLAENGGMEYAVQMVKLSLSCLVQDPKDRPDMVEVVSFLLKMQSNVRINQFLI